MFRRHTDIGSRSRRWFDEGLFIHGWNVERRRLPHRCHPAVGWVAPAGFHGGSFGVSGTPPQRPSVADSGIRKPRRESAASSPSSRPNLSQKAFESRFRSHRGTVHASTRRRNKPVVWRLRLNFEGPSCAMAPVAPKNGDPKSGHQRSRHLWSRSPPMLQDLPSREVVMNRG
jgi:hypothetical protein